MATRRYTVLIDKGPRSYGATVPDLPGCVAVARSRREVLRLIGEAIPQHLAGMADAGEMVPPLVHEAAIVEVKDSPRVDHRLVGRFKRRGRASRVTLAAKDL
jgi:predicted RNase H-like HicB family nuclease